MFLYNIRNWNIQTIRQTFNVSLVYKSTFDVFSLASLFLSFSIHNRLSQEKLYRYSSYIKNFFNKNEYKRRYFRVIFLSILGNKKKVDDGKI
jgi:hypothetical protein